MSGQPQHRKLPLAYVEVGATFSVSYIGSDIKFSEPTYFELKVLIADCVPWKGRRKMSVERRSMEQSIYRVNFQIRFDIMTTMIVQNSIFRTNLFRIESFGSWLCPFCQNVAAGRNSERNLNRRMENFPVSLEVNKEFSEKLTQSKFKIAVKNVSHCSL